MGATRHKLLASVCLAACMCAGARENIYEQPHHCLAFTHTCLRALSVQALEDQDQHMTDAERKRLEKQQFQESDEVRVCVRV